MDKLHLWKNKKEIYMEEIISNSPEETMELGKKIASTLKKGDVIVLTRRFGDW